MLADALNAAVARHKDIAKKLIYASNNELTIKALDVASSSTAPGSTMFGDLDTDPAEPLVDFGPFKCIWTDADSAKAQPNSREAIIVDRNPDAEVVAKLWLADVLVDETDFYGETLLNRARYVSARGKRYELLGFDRYGLGTSPPYIIAIVLRGSFTADG